MQTMQNLDTSRFREKIDKIKLNSNINSKNDMVT